MTRIEYVTTGKPKIGGAIFKAPIGTSLPTSANSALNSAFKNLGYCSEDGLVNEDTRENEDHKAWGGDIVLTSQTEKKDIFKLKLIEALNEEVLKTIYGENNVSGTLENGLTVKVNSKEQSYFSWVFEIIFKNGVLKRIVVPSAKITEVSEIKYADNEPVGYEITLNTSPDSQGQTHYEYILKGRA